MTTGPLKRRDFLTLVGAAGAAAAFPRIAFAQQATVKRLEFVITLTQADPDAPKDMAAIWAGLRSQGWEEGKNLAVNYWWGSATADTARLFASQMVDAKPDAILAVGTVNAVALAAVTMQVPVVFALVVDPLALGLTDNLSRPSRNLTGFTQSEPSIGGKLVELLKEAAPDIKTVGWIFNPMAQSSGSGGLAIAMTAKALGMDFTQFSVNAVPDIPAAVREVAARPLSGLVVGPDSFLTVNHALVVSEVARNRLPAAYWHAFYGADGGLITDAVDPFELLQNAGEYAGRVLSGAPIEDLPVQAPSKYTLSVNLKTARAQGITIPASLLAQADEIVE